MGSNEPASNECEVKYEIFHILNCGTYLWKIGSNRYCGKARSLTTDPI